MSNEFEDNKDPFGDMESNFDDGIDFEEVEEVEDEEELLEEVSDESDDEIEESFDDVVGEEDFDITDDASDDAKSMNKKGKMVMYAAVGGFVLIVGLVGINMFGGSSAPPQKQKPVAQAVKKETKTPEGLLKNKVTAENSEAKQLKTSGDLRSRLGLSSPTKKDSVSSVSEESKPKMPSVKHVEKVDNINDAWEDDNSSIAKVSTKKPSLISKDDIRKNIAPSSNSNLKSIPAFNNTVAEKKIVPVQNNSSLTIGSKKTADMREINDRLDTMESSISVLEENYAELDDRMGAMESATDKITDAVDKLSVTVTDIAKKVKEGGYSKKSASSKKASKRVSLPTYTLLGATHGKAWIQSKSGSVVTLTKGESLKGYGKVLSVSANGVIKTESGNVKVKRMK